LRARLIGRAAMLHRPFIALDDERVHYRDTFAQRMHDDWIKIDGGGVVGVAVGKP